MADGTGGMEISNRNAVNFYQRRVLSDLWIIVFLFYF